MANAHPARRLTLVLVVVALVAVLGAALLALRRHRREEGERQARAQAAEKGPRVLVARVAAARGERAVTLPGDVRAFWQTTLYARVSGYVKDLAVDKGDRVKKNQVLARIESPETDHQVAQAQATLSVRQRTAARARTLAPKGIMTQQELDQATSDLGVAEAELRRLRSLQAYETVRAPFDGVVTARFVDPGALVNATGTGQPVVEVSSPDRVRVLVYVGQDVAPFVRLGDAADVALDQLPGVKIAARVQRLADALDPRSRSMLVEAWPDDSPVRLVPGTFAHVTLHVKVPPLPTVPAEALVARGDKLAVARVENGRLRFVEVETGFNDGKVLQIRSGVAEGDVIALSPPSDLGDGAPVQPAEKEAPAAAPGSGARSARAAPAR
jgi:membrane fusion protein, multidrug efflux system